MNVFTSKYVNWPPENLPVLLLSQRKGVEGDQLVLRKDKPWDLGLKYFKIRRKECVMSKQMFKIAPPKKKAPSSETLKKQIRLSVSRNFQWLIKKTEETCIGLAGLKPQQ